MLQTYERWLKMVKQHTEISLGSIFQPDWLLRIEGAVLLVGSVWFYAVYSGNWLLFALLLLAPDLSALGYLVNNRFGNITYNIGHTLLFPALLVAYGFLTVHPATFPFALIWFAHIGMDRLVGYRLKSLDATRKGQ